MSEVSRNVRYKDRLLLVCAGMGGEEETRSKRGCGEQREKNSKEVLEKQQGMRLIEMKKSAPLVYELAKRYAKKETLIEKSI